MFQPLPLVLILFAFLYAHDAPVHDGARTPASCAPAWLAVPRLQILTLHCVPPIAELLEYQFNELSLEQLF